MEKYFKSILNQIRFNQGKNIFLDDESLSLEFTDETKNAIAHLDEIDQKSATALIDYATEKALEEFCRINQYYAFDSQAKDALRNIYKELLLSLKEGKYPIETIARNHYLKIKNWLRETNPFAEKMYANEAPKIEQVACSEYSPELQLEILKIDTNVLTEPVLDIGCGKKGALVNHLRKLGLAAFGIDRVSFSNSYLTNADWLEYDYGIEKWGTIMSNLGFSNHFRHHDLREDGNYIAYGKKYMSILNSLKIGGKFHYTPDLPFIEMYLDTTQFKIDKYELGEYDFKTSILTRMR